MVAVIVDEFVDKSGICYKLFLKNTKVSRYFQYKEHYKKFGPKYCVIEKLNDRFLRICCEDINTLRRGLEWLVSLA